MYIIAINHDVEGYDRWKAVFDKYPPSAGGATFHRINRNVDNPDNITVVAGFDTAEKALDFRDDPALKGAMADAGVVGTPRFEIFEEVESVLY